MKAAFLLSALVVIVSARPDGQYTDKFDNVDLPEILSNKRLLHPYIECLLDERPCTPDGKELKSNVKEALQTNCAKCTEVQRSGSRKVIGHLINHEPEYWKQLSAKYDQGGKFAAKYEKDLKSVA